MEKEDRRRCHLCESQFDTRNSLRKHLKKRHNNVGPQKEKEVEKTVMEKAGQKEAGEQGAKDKPGNEEQGGQGMKRGEETGSDQEGKKTKTKKMRKVQDLDAIFREMIIADPISPLDESQMFDCQRKNQDQRRNDPIFRVPLPPNPRVKSSPTRKVRPQLTIPTLYPESKSEVQMWIEEIDRMNERLRMCRSELVKRKRVMDETNEQMYTLAKKRKRTE